MPPMASFLEGKFGWGGRTRTFTVRINSAVSYRLDHAPVVGQNTIPLQERTLGARRVGLGRAQLAAQISLQRVSWNWGYDVLRDLARRGVLRRLCLVGLLRRAFF